MSANRMHLPGTVHFITSRTEHEMLFLLPTEKTTTLIQSWFARAMCKYGRGLEIYAFIFLSNHFHLLVRDTEGTLAAFMCYFLGNLAKAINRELKRKGTFWSREYDDVIVDGEKEFWDRYAYTTCNAVKSGLVDTALEWPGWCSLKNALSAEPYKFEMLNATKLHNATRRGQKVDITKFIERWSFALTTPPSLLEKSSEERKQFIENLIESAETEFRAKRENKPALGRARILKQHPTDRPKSSSFRPRIKVFSLNRERRRELQKCYRTFVGIYRETIDTFRKAASKRNRQILFEWPEGSYPPSCIYPFGSAYAS